MTENIQEIGKQRIKEILGESAAEIIASFEKVSPDFSNYVVNFAYGDLYNREGFADKFREMAAVSCLLGQGNTGLPLRAHLQGMLNVGWEKKDIIELLIFLIGYVGFPSVVNAMGVLAAVNEGRV